jgi:hypothetical protein
VSICGLEAHKPVTSKYTYNEHVFPILRDKCGHCHRDGGPAPMSLLSYKENGGAVAWAESIREMLTTEAMPPYYVDPTGPAVKNDHFLTPRELDIVLTWTSGGTPEGDPKQNTVVVPTAGHWPMGRPDLALEMNNEHTVGAGTTEETIEFTLPTRLPKATWLKAVDLLPGTPAMVRRAVVSAVDGEVLMVWQPGDEGQAAPVGTAFRLPANATLRVAIYYKKPWQEVHAPKSDRSTIGLYFSSAPSSGKAIEEEVVVDESLGKVQETGSRRFSRTLARDVRVMGIRTSLDRRYASIEINAVKASGERVPLLKLRAPRPEWPRRYWLVDSVGLRAGTTIEVKAVASELDVEPAVALVTNRFQIALDVVP